MGRGSTNSLPRVNKITVATRFFKEAGLLFAPGFILFLAENGFWFMFILSFKAWPGLVVIYIYVPQFAKRLPPKMKKTAKANKFIISLN